MTVEQMRKFKRKHGYTYDQIAELSGLPLGTVQKVFLGITKTPRYDTLKALESVFLPDLIEEEKNYGEKQKKKLTLEDYLALPEDERVELIDGVIYDMADPADKHQIIAGEIFASFRDYVRKKKGACIALMSPVDVQLDCDDYTVVQPDVLIVCDRDKFRDGRVFGAPDLVVEVLSPSTRKKDMYIKTGKYMVAGVREYWVVDPKKQKVIVYNFELEEDIAMYTFRDRVPVGIWNGECEVDFTDISEYASFLE